MPFALLQAIAEQPEEELRRGLGHLQAAEFLYETSLFPELEYTFKHALTHEVAYGSLLHERAERCTPGSSRPSSGSTRTAWRSTSSAWPTTPFRARAWDKAVRYVASREGGAARAANHEAST